MNAHWPVNRPSVVYYAVRFSATAAYEVRARRHVLDFLVPRQGVWPTAANDGSVHRRDRWAAGPMTRVPADRANHFNFE